MLNISLYQAIASRYQHLRIIRAVRMMNIISHQIEQQIVQYQMPVELYVGFQRFSNFFPQSHRYEQLASICHHIYVFGIADVRPPSIPGIKFIELSAQMLLAQEWFLLVDAPEFWTLLTTREIETRTIKGERQFDGLWTFEAPVVESASQLLTSALGQTYTPSQERYLALQHQNVSDTTESLLQLISLR